MKAAFMAPIFMFFMYLIFLLVNSDFVEGLASSHKGFMQSIMLVLLPGIIILTLLMQAISYAKKGAGKVSEVVAGGLKAAGGMALGGAALGAAVVGRNTIGSFMKGASTRDTAATRITENKNILRDKNVGLMRKIGAVAEIGKGGLQRGLGINAAQGFVGKWLNNDEREVKHSAHARQKLDKIGRAHV